MTKNVDVSLGHDKIAKEMIVKCYISRTSLNQELNGSNVEKGKNKDGRTSESDLTSPRKTDYNKWELSHHQCSNAVTYTDLLIIFFTCRI